MVKVLVLGFNKDYSGISFDESTIKQKISEMKFNLDGEKLIACLLTPNKVYARSCRPYGASIPFRITGRKTNLPADISDFFEQIKKYGEEHNVEYALVQDFNFQSGRMKNELSATVQLLFED